MYAIIFLTTPKGVMNAAADRKADLRSVSGRLGLGENQGRLELRGIKTAMGKSQWYPTVISHVLKNSFYCGIITYNKEYVPDYLKQRK